MPRILLTIIAGLAFVNACSSGQVRDGLHPVAKARQVERQMWVDRCYNLPVEDPCKVEIHTGGPVFEGPRRVLTGTVWIDRYLGDEIYSEHNLARVREKACSMGAFLIDGKESQLDIGAGITSVFEYNIYGPRPNDLFSNRSYVPKDRSSKCSVLD